MTEVSLDYDLIAPTYDSRYAVNRLEGLAAALRALARRTRADRVLEVGCGTGRWLAELRAVVPAVYGLDRSLGMLRQARANHRGAQVASGLAGDLPFPAAAFDLVLCVNALHHFQRPAALIAEARRLLRPSGALAIIGLDPHTGHDRWYLYDYFAGTLEADLRRYPSADQVGQWMTGEGFQGVERRVVERIVDAHIGRAVLSDPFLRQQSTSQLALLSDADYAAGVRRLEAEVRRAEDAGQRPVFPVDLSLIMLVGTRPGR